MARYNDFSCDCTRWSNRKLMSEARKYANLESMETASFDGPEPVTFTPGWDGQVGNKVSVADFCREQTRLYRYNAVDILDEIERRFVKSSRKMEQTK